MTPGITTNPHDPARTPGGSSSGSGAAVADRMVPVAFGTQTGGSVLRPAAYCGVFGFKPTYNAFNRRGVFPAAESLDTLGPPGALARRHRAAERRAGTAPAVKAHAARPRAAHRALPHAALEHRAARDGGGGRGRGRAARQGRRASPRDRAPAGVFRSAQRRARDHQQHRARRRHGARMEHAPRADQRAAAQAHRARTHDAARGLRRGAAARRRAAAPGSARSSPIATCCSRRLPTARRRSASATPAIRASRRSGPFCTRRR